MTQLYECFSHWGKYGQIWLYSDPHFDDTELPNWPSAQEQVSRINQSVRGGDTLIVLGDIGNPAHMKDIKVKQKILICGNHDKGASNYTEYFDEIYCGPLFISPRILLSHEPIDIPFGINIHGHNHNGECNGLNVCSNCIEFRPVSLDKNVKAGLLAGVLDIHQTYIKNLTR